MNTPPSCFGIPSQLQLPNQAVPNFWQRDNLHEHMNRLHEMVVTGQEVLCELEAIEKVDTHTHSDAMKDCTSEDCYIQQLSLSNNCMNEASVPFFEVLSSMMTNFGAHKSVSIEAARSLCSNLRVLLGPLTSLASQACPWEEKSAASKLVQKLEKSRRNKRWRKRKRNCAAQFLAQKHGDFAKLDQQADKWRAEEIAKDIAQNKVASMKRIAKKKAKEEKEHLESELELALVVEKLEELRSIRIQKLKKKGHFFPEEDDIFLNQVKASVDEEERQATADAAKAAIAVAESQKPSTSGNTNSNVCDRNAELTEHNQEDKVKFGRSFGIKENPAVSNQTTEAPAGFDSLFNLPFEYYHYYHGSSNDMGTLIEVRRTWDLYIRPGGSRIPGHWVEPPPPADEVWASYLVQPKSNSSLVGD